MFIITLITLESRIDRRCQLVSTVAMDSTGVNWLPLYWILEQAGIRVSRVNSKHARKLHEFLVHREQPDSPRRVTDEMNSCRRSSCADSLTC